ncbi:peptidase M20 [Chitinispirillum alkaliphilum]|nr:peptidase M20 [Chitinispirillum alkaliphilum]
MTGSQKLYGGSSINENRLKKLFKNMVDIYSPSGKEDELTAFLWEYIAGCGLAVQRQNVDENRSNLLISSGRGEPDTLFLGHIDTVPAFDIEDYGFAERDGICYGLGTADMKSGCAALLEAFLTAAMLDCLPDNILLALVVGEEEVGDGTQRLLSEYSFKHALVAEPTDMKPCLDHYGYVEMNLRTFGYRRHAAMSNKETNAIRAMLRFLLHLEESVEQSEPKTVLNIRDLYSSESGFAVPDRCAASVDLHIPPDTDVTSYVDGLKVFVENQIKQSGISSHEIDFPTICGGYRIHENDIIPGMLKTVYDEFGMYWAPISFKSHSDANLLHNAGCRPCILGPGQLAKAHTNDESVIFDQVRRAAEVYFQLISEMNSENNYPH